MASLISLDNGTRRIQFVAPCGKRKTIYLGKCSKRDAETVKFRVESLLSSNITGAMDRDTSFWVTAISEKNRDLRSKLESVGLLEPLEPVAQCPTVSNYVDSYLERMKASKKPATIVNWTQAGKNLKELLPEGIRMNEVTAGHAKVFCEKLKATRIASSTLQKRVQIAKQIFEDAVDWKTIESNPFHKIDVKSHRVKGNTFIALETIDRLMPFLDTTWKTIIALCRFGGLRCPSEVLSLRWDDIDWEKSIMRIPEPKVEHHEGRGLRSCPIFGELLPYLRDAFEAAPEGAEFVIDKPAYREAANTGTGWKNANLRTQLLKKLAKAKIEPWGRLFHSMRASRQTELERSFPLHVVCAWLGNTPEIAHRNYLLVTDNDIQRAIRGNAQCNAVGAHTPSKSNVKCNAASNRNKPQQQEGYPIKTLGFRHYSRKEMNQFSGRSGSRTPTPFGTRS